SVLLTAPVLLYFLFLATYGLASGGVGSQGVVAMTLMGLADETTAAQVLSAYQFAIAAGILAGGVLAERYGRHGLVAAVFLLTAAGLLVLPPILSPTGLLLFGIFILSGFGFGAVLPARDLMVRAITPPGASGRVFGFVFVGLSIGSGLAGVVFGALVDAGYHAWVFPIAGGLLVLAVIITTFAQIAAAKT
ncbi:MAG: MFS transporter, partial [Alphaproteobacteria bacterium]